MNRITKILIQLTASALAGICLGKVIMGKVINCSKKSKKEDTDALSDILRYEEGIEDKEGCDRLIIKRSGKDWKMEKSKQFSDPGSSVYYSISHKMKDSEISVLRAQILSLVTQSAKRPEENRFVHVIYIDGREAYYPEFCMYYLNPVFEEEDDEI